MYNGNELGALPALAIPPAPTLAALSIDDVLYGLRMHESGGNYKAQSRISSASGAYQYIAGTWNRWRGYAKAADAPPAVQDERARADLAANYARYRDWRKAVAAHFYPAWANDPARWGNAPSPGNPTVNQYVAAVLSGATRALAQREASRASGPVLAYDPKPTGKVAAPKAAARPAINQASMTTAGAAGVLAALWHRAQQTRGKGR